MRRDIACMALALATVASQVRAQRPVTIASKPFGESYILAEMFGQLLESRGITVDRRPGLGATEIAFGALRSGAIDVYPEYTGTGLLAILHDTPRTNAADVYGYVARTFRERWGIRWLAPLGFENTYAIAMRRGAADSLGIRTLSDVARHADQLRGGFTPDFIGRADGLAGLRETYGWRLKDVRSLVPAVKYEALASGTVDVIDGYSTDGLIARYNLVVLEDDRHFFPPYEAAALVGAALQRENPQALFVLGELSGRMDVRLMRALNARVEVNKEPVADVARRGLQQLGLLDSASTRRPVAARASDSLVDYVWSRRSELAALALRHVELVVASLAAAILVAVPLGLLVNRVGGAELTIRAVGLLQTIPGIALLAFMIPLIGIGVVPALVALWLYSLYPIVRNTYTGLRDADRAACDSAHALGMTEGQVLRYVRLPLATPVIMAGIRTAAVIGVGTATLAAFIGAGGLGDPIVAGLALADSRMILSGAIPAAILALVVDALLALAERRLSPTR